MKEKLKFVIVGHVDHGKSTLIGRLLYDTKSLSEEKIEEIKKICNSLGKEFEFSYIMDNLEEERNQGITIDTTQIFFRTEKRTYVIIDTPGHKEFIKNMISGATLADAAILIIDIQEGIKEQTKRHAFLLQFLQLLSPIVLINKMDLVNYDQNKYEKLKKKIEKLLLKLGIEPLSVIPISARKGDFVVNKDNMISWYKGPTLLEILENVKIKKNTNNLLRFTVQDVYNFDKKDKIDKRIIVGKVESGIIRKGDEIKILPSGEKSRIKSIEEYLRENLTSAETGKSIGITIEDKLSIDRGNVIISSNEFDDKIKITNRIKTNIFWMDNIPCKKGEILWFRCGTQEVKCEIEKIEKILNSSSLELLTGEGGIRNRETATVIIKTYKPVIVESLKNKNLKNLDKTEVLGRFVLGRNDVCACGMIL